MKTMAITKMAAVLLLLRRQEDRNQVRRLLRLLSVANRSTLRVIARDGQSLEFPVGCDQAEPRCVGPGGEPQHYEQCPGELVLMIRLQSAEGQEKVERITHDPDALARVTGSIHEEQWRPVPPMPPRYCPELWIAALRSAPGTDLQ